MLATRSVASAANPDPIFAAITRHREAWRVFSDASVLTDEVRADNEGRDVTEADEATYEAASDAETEARDALFQTPAQTPAGLRALIEYYIDYDAGMMDELAAALLEALLRSPILAVGGVRVMNAPVRGLESPDPVELSEFYSCPSALFTGARLHIVGDVAHLLFYSEQPSATASKTEHVLVARMAAPVATARATFRRLVLAIEHGAASIAEALEGLPN